MAVFLFLLAFICILISGIYAPIIALIYLFIGFLVLTSYPTRTIISREADRLSLGNWANWEEEYKPVPEKKILYFKIVVKKRAQLRALFQSTIKIERIYAVSILVALVYPCDLLQFVYLQLSYLFFCHCLQLFS